MTRQRILCRILSLLLVVCMFALVSCDIIDFGGLNGSTTQTDGDEKDDEKDEDKDKDTGFLDIGEHTHIYSEKGKCTLCGDTAYVTSGLEYSLAENGMAYTLSGIGKAKDTDIIVPDMYKGKPVTKVGRAAFYDCQALKSIKLPNMLTNIEDAAFSDCYNLESINIPDTVVSIGNGAFIKCDKAKQVENDIEYVGNWAIHALAVGRDVEVRGGTVGIADTAFASNGVLRNVVLPEGLKFIGNDAFTGCCELKKITIPDSIISIGEFVFEGCFALEEILFSGTQEQWLEFLKNANLGEILEQLNVVFGGNAETNETEHTHIFDETGKCIGCDDTIEVTQGLEYTLISDNTEYEVSGIGTATDTDIVIPGMYNGKRVTRIGAGAFQDCSTFKETIVLSITSVTVTNGITSIEHGAFAYCTTIKNVVLPSELKIVGDYAFYLLCDMNEIMLPNSVTYIGEYAFYNCDKFKRVVFDGTMEQWNQIEKGREWNQNCGGFVVVCIDGVLDKYGNQI